MSASTIQLAVRSNYQPPAGNESYRAADFSINKWTAFSSNTNTPAGTAPSAFTNQFNPFHLWQETVYGVYGVPPYTDYNTDSDICKPAGYQQNRNRVSDADDTAVLSAALSAAFGDVWIGNDLTHNGSTYGLYIPGGTVNPGDTGVFLPFGCLLQYEGADGSTVYDYAHNTPLYYNGPTIGPYYAGGATFETFNGVATVPLTVYAPTGLYLQGTIHFLAGAFSALTDVPPHYQFSVAASGQLLEITSHGIFPSKSDNGDAAHYGTNTLSFVCPGDLLPPVAAPPGGSGAIASAFLALDAHRRPLAAQGGSGGITGLWSNDAGHSFSSASIVAAGADPSLLVDTRTNRFSLIYCRPADPSGTPAAALMRAFGQIADGYPQDAGSPAALTGISGQFPIAVKHPSDRDYTLLAYLGGGALKTAFSLDFGATWNALGTVDTGLDFTATGRAGLCWLGEMAIVVYGSGNNLLCRTSRDRGQTWGAAVTIGTAGPYSGLSLLGWQGRLYLLSWTIVVSGSTSTPTPALIGSSDLGVTWSATFGSLPTLTPPTALGVLPQSGQLRLGTTNYSANDAATWPAD